MAQLRTRGLEISDDENAQADIELIAVDVDRLRPFRDHIFRKPLSPAKYNELLESVRSSGILQPLRIRHHMLERGCFEIIAGHNRLKAAKEAGLPVVPALLVTESDDGAMLAMIDSNIQREEIPPSERGWAYRRKMEILNRQGKRPDSTSVQSVQKFGGDKEPSTSRQIIAEQAGDNEANVSRYIRLTYLIEPLQDLVDDKVIKVGQGVEISYMDEPSQLSLFNVVEVNETAISMEQAKEMRSMSKEQSLSVQDVKSILLQSAKSETKFSVSLGRIREQIPRKYRDKELTKQQWSEVAIKAFALLNSLSEEELEALFSGETV